MVLANEFKCQSLSLKPFERQFKIPFACYGDCGLQVTSDVSTDLSARVAFSS